MDWTERTMSMPRATNFGVFCLVVVAMLAVEVMWGRRAISTDARNTLQMAGFISIAAFVIAEGAMVWRDARDDTRDRPRSRGFPVQRKDGRK